ncbi:MAG: hypothetical protein AB7G75_37510 [Candidatus Binatia bacterium]
MLSEETLLERDQFLPDGLKAGEQRPEIGIESEWNSYGRLSITVPLLPNTGDRAGRWLYRPALGFCLSMQKSSPNRGLWRWVALLPGTLWRWHLMLLIFTAGWVVLARREWFAQPDIRGYVVMLATGLAVGVSVEWMAVRIVGRWAYTTQTPFVPGLSVGIVLLLLMLVLPPLIFRVAAV